MQNKMIAGISAAAMAAGLGFGLSQVATADTTSPTPTPSASASPGTDGTAGTGEERGGHRGGGRGMFGGDVATLAEKLGVEEAALEEAIDAAREGLDPVAPDSASTDEEREAAREERESAYVSALAAELGIDEATVQAAIDEVRAEREAERAAADTATLDQAVTDGDLTRAEADAVQKAIDAGIGSTRGGHRR